MAWPILILAVIAAAVAGGMIVRRRRILSRTRAVLALSTRLDTGEGGSMAAPLKFAAPPISIRARLDIVPAHG